MACTELTGKILGIEIGNFLNSDHKSRSSLAYFNFNLFGFFLNE